MDAEKIGEAFVRLVVISRALDHADLRCTARDYLLPHAAERTPEQQFVLDAVTSPASALLSDDDLTRCLAAIDLPALT